MNQKTVWTPEMDALLGIKKDKELAHELGCHKQTVAERRWKLGIPSWKHRKWTPEMVALLGTIPDIELAKKMGIHNAAVAAKRNRMSIPSWQGQQDYTHAETKRSQTLWYNYGITLGEYDEMLERQGGGCAICGRTTGDDTGRRLSVDHDHETGEVRGLLCSKCNQGLGMFQDDPDQMRRAIGYLESPTKVQTTKS